MFTFHEIIISWNGIDVENIQQLGEDLISISTEENANSESGTPGLLTSRITFSHQLRRHSADQKV